MSCQPPAGSEGTLRLVIYTAVGDTTLGFTGSICIKDVLGGLHHEYWLEEIAA